MPFGSPPRYKRAQRPKLPEAHPLDVDVRRRALQRECVFRSLTDQPALELRERREHRRHHLPGRRRGIDSEIEGDQIADALATALHERREVEERPREPVELGNDERLRLTPRRRRRWPARARGGPSCLPDAPESS